MKDNLFDKTSEFDTLSAFKKDFPMLANNKRSIPPFVMPNTVNGAAIIFNTPDKSQFIYTMCSHRVYLIGPSREFVKHFKDDDLICWIIENILNLKDTNYTKNGDEYIVKYNNRDYILFGYFYETEDKSFYYFNIREDD